MQMHLYFWPIPLAPLPAAMGTLLCERLTKPTTDQIVNKMVHDLWFYGFRVTVNVSVNPKIDSWYIYYTHTQRHTHAHIHMPLFTETRHTEELKAITAFDFACICNCGC